MSTPAAVARALGLVAAAALGALLVWLWHDAGRRVGAGLEPPCPWHDRAAVGRHSIEPHDHRPGWWR